MTGTVKTVKVVADRATISYDITITVNTVDTTYRINMLNLLSILKKVGEYPSIDVVTDLTGYEIEFDVDTFNCIKNVALVEAEEVTP